MENLTQKDLDRALSVLTSLTPLAEEIAGEVHNGRIYNVEFTEPDVVKYVYNGSCNCHPEDEYGYFPSEWLFDPEWRGKVAEFKRKKEEERVQAQKEREQKRKEASERLNRQLFESLKKKYEPTTQS